MAKPPKLATIEKRADFSHWLADVIQRAVSREDAGFVQITRTEGPDDAYLQASLKDTIVVANGITEFALEITGGAE